MSTDSSLWSVSLPLQLDTPVQQDELLSAAIAAHTATRMCPAPSQRPAAQKAAAALSASFRLHGVSKSPAAQLDVRATLHRPPTAIVFTKYDRVRYTRKLGSGRSR